MGKGPLAPAEGQAPSAYSESRLLVEESLTAFLPPRRPLHPDIRTGNRANLMGPEGESEIKLYRTRGLNPRVRPMGRAAASPPCGVMDRDSTGETSSALYPPQEAGFTLNLL